MERSRCGAEPRAHTAPAALRPRILRPRQQLRPRCDRVLLVRAGWLILVGGRRDPLGARHATHRGAARGAGATPDAGKARRALLCREPRAGCARPATGSPNASRHVCCARCRRDALAVRSQAGHKIAHLLQCFAPFFQAQQLPLQSIVKNARI